MLKKWEKRGKMIQSFCFKKDRFKVTVQDNSSAMVFRRKIPGYACKNPIIEGDL